MKFKTTEMQFTYVEWVALKMLKERRYEELRKFLTPKMVEASGLLRAILKNLDDGCPQAMMDEKEEKEKQ